MLQQNYVIKMKICRLKFLRNSVRCDSNNFNVLTYYSSDELVVAQMIRVAVAGRIDHVSHPVARGNREQRVHGVEYVSRNNHVPFPEQTAGILALLVCKNGN